MASLADVVQSILPMVPGAPEQVVINTYLRAAREFFTRSLCWREVLDDIAVVANTAVYTLDPGDGKEVFDASLCEIDEVSLMKLTYTQARRRIGSTSVASSPKYFRISLGNELTLMPTPAESGALISLFGMIRPTLDATEIPDEIAFMYSYALEAGALSFLYRQLGQPWTEQKASLVHHTLFTDEIDRWRSLGADGGMVGVPRRTNYGGIR